MMKPSRVTRKSNRLSTRQDTSCEVVSDYKKTVEEFILSDPLVPPESDVKAANEAPAVPSESDPKAANEALVGIQKPVVLLLKEVSGCESETNNKLDESNTAESSVLFGSAGTPVPMPTSARLSRRRSSTATCRFHDEKYAKRSKTHRRSPAPSPSEMVSMQQELNRSTSSESPVVLKLYAHPNFGTEPPAADAEFNLAKENPAEMSRLVRSSSKKYVSSDERIETDPPAANAEFNLAKENPTEISKLVRSSSKKSMSIEGRIETEPPTADAESILAKENPAELSKLVRSSSKKSVCREGRIERESPAADAESTLAKENPSAEIPKSIRSSSKKSMNNGGIIETEPRVADVESILAKKNPAKIPKSGRLSEESKSSDERIENEEGTSSLSSKLNEDLMTDVDAEPLNFCATEEFISKIAMSERTHLVRHIDRIIKRSVKRTEEEFKSKCIPRLERTRLRYIEKVNEYKRWRKEIDKKVSTWKKEKQLRKKVENERDEFARKLNVALKETERLKIKLTDTEEKLGTVNILLGDEIQAREKIEAERNSLAGQLTEIRRVLKQEPC